MGHETDEQYFPFPDDNSHDHLTIEGKQIPLPPLHSKAPLGSLVNPNLVQMAGEGRQSEQGLSALQSEDPDAPVRVWTRESAPYDPKLDYVEAQGLPPEFVYLTPDEIAQQKEEQQMNEEPLSPDYVKNLEEPEEVISVDELTARILEEDKRRMKAKRGALGAWTRTQKPPHPQTVFSREEEARQAAGKPPRQTEEYKGPLSEIPQEDMYSSRSPLNEFERRKRERLFEKDDVYRAQQEQSTQANPTQSLSEWQRQKSDYEKKLEDSTETVRDVIPGAVIQERTWPFHQAWEQQADGTKRNAEEELAWYREQQKRIDNAITTGQFDQLEMNDRVSQEDILEIAKTAAEHAIAKQEAQKNREKYESELSQKRAREMQTGIPEGGYDPDFTVDYANQLMDVAHQQELADYRQWLQQEHEAHQQQIQDERFERLRNEMLTTEEPKVTGLGKIRNFFRRK